MKNRLYDIQSRPLDFKLRVESSSNEYEDIKYTLQDMKKALEYFSDTKYNENKNRRQDLISINNIDFGICYIMNIIIEAIKQDNIAELTVIHYMISLMEFDQYNTHTRFTKYFNKIIKAFLRITKKNDTKDFNENYWYTILSKHYYRSLYYLYTNAYKCNYFNTWIRELNHLLYY